MAKLNNLDSLHEKLAHHMLNALKHNEQAQMLLVEYPELPSKVKELLEELCDVNPALFTSISKFLKDNNITAVIEDSDEMSELEKRLAAKRRPVATLSVVEA